MALLIQPTKITKKLVEQICSYEPHIDLYSDAGADQIKDLLDNLLPLFQKCSLKRQKQVVDKITQGKTKWYTGTVAYYICRYSFDHGDTRLAKFVYKTYLTQNSTFKKLLQEEIDVQDIE